MIDLTLLDALRVKTPEILKAYGSYGDSGNGAFMVPSPDGRKFFFGVIVSNGGGWDHVSVSLRDRCPTWDEMEHIKKMFFGDEVVMQLHVPADEHVNVHHFCLHLWRPNDNRQIPTPPSWMVG